jgi:hypothetical protein
MPMPDSFSHVFTVDGFDSSIASRSLTQGFIPQSARRSEMPILIDTPDVVSASRLAAMLAPVECELFPSGPVSWRVQIHDPADLNDVIKKIRDWLAHEEIATTDVVVDGDRRIVVSRHISQ